MLFLFAHTFFVCQYLPKYDKPFFDVIYIEIEEESKYKVKEKNTFQHFFGKLQDILRK